MTLSELLSYRYVCAELNRLTSLLADLEQDRCGKAVGGEHVSCGIGDRTASAAATIVDMQIKVNRLAEHKRVVEQYIEGIERADIKYTMQARFIEGMTYPEISGELKRHKINVTARGLRQRVERYLKKQG